MKKTQLHRKGNSCGCGIEITPVYNVCKNSGNIIIIVSGKILEKGRFRTNYDLFQGMYIHVRACTCRQWRKVSLREAKQKKIMWASLWATFTYLLNAVEGIIHW